MGVTSDKIVALVVPTRNSGRTIAACLRSIKSQDVPCRIVVVDNFSTDQTQRLAVEWAHDILVQGPERSAQRNAGARLVGCDVVGFIDSDMILEQGVVRQAAALIRSGAVGVVVPERSFGEGYWSSVRAYERSFYDGLDDVESARFFDKSVFDAVGGFDEQLNAGEDWDLTIRIRPYGRVDRTSARIHHDEGRLSYRTACAKKASYAVGVMDFRSKHGSAALQKALARPYLRRPWILFARSPSRGVGVLVLKLGEAASVSWALLSALIRSKGSRLRRPR